MRCFNLNIPQLYFIQPFNLLVELLREVARHITGEFELYALGAELGVTVPTTKSLLRDYRGNNEGSYQVLRLWRQEGIDQQRDRSEMKKDLRRALSSELVLRNDIVDDLEDYFCLSGESDEEPMSPSTPAPSTSAARQPEHKDRHVRYV